MRLNVESMYGYSIQAVDGELGKVKDFYFDDISWKLRYLVVKTGSWLLGRKVLISFASIKNVDHDSSVFIVDLTCEQVKNSPNIDTDKPVYLQHEMMLNAHYMLPDYWIDAPGVILGMNDYLASHEDITCDKEEEKELKKEEKKSNHHLRSTKQIEDYLIHATDGEIGHVKDFIFQKKNWQITELLVETRNLLAGRKVLLHAKNILKIEWENSEVYTNISRGDIINSPEFDIEKDL
jgi:sporulation protein YlmC with PRC-barrel domain